MQMELGGRELVMKFHRSYALNIVNYMRQKKNDYCEGVEVLTEKNVA